MRVPFPKHHPKFQDSTKLVKRISQVESYIEIFYDMLTVEQSIDALMNFSPQIKEIEAEFKANMDKKWPTRPSYLSYPEFPTDAQDKPQSEFDKDRDAIWNLKNKYGVMVVLAFLDPKLLVNIEMLFAGVVVTYIKVFNESKRGRTKLESSKVFSGNDELKNFHQKVTDLRNKQFAHAEMSGNQHNLHFIREHAENDIQIKFGSVPPHSTDSFHENIDLRLFRKCVRVVKKHVEEKIKGLTDSIKSELSPEQLALLKEISQEDANRYSAPKLTD